MPFVRFSRDRRGYEHLYLVDSKDHGRSRVIYWFRTPPGVKVGRSPFDTATQQSLERQYPDVKFDWPQIVAARIPPLAPVENWREKRRAERAFKRARAEEAVEGAELPPPPEEPLSSETDGEEDGLGGEPDGKVEGKVEGQVEDTAQILPTAEASSNPVSGTRRRRRRRRRGRRPNTPNDAAGPPPDPDGPLDPTDSLEKPSNEG